MQRDPIRLLSCCEPRRRAEHGLRQGITANADDDALSARPWPFNPLLAQMSQHLFVHAISRASQRQFAQGRQVARPEELIDGAACVLRQIDFAVLQALDQLLGRQINDDDLIGPLEDLVGHRLLHANAGDALNHVLQAFKMLDVERRPDINAVTQDFLDVLIALGMDEARRVRVRELVDQQQFWLARNRCFDIELHERATPIRNRLPWQHLEPIEQCSRFRSAVRLDDAHQHIEAFGLLRPGSGQHGVGFAHARCHAEENLELAAALFRSQLE